MAAFCSTCGWKYEGSPSFCQQCGTPLGQAAAGIAAAPAAAAAPQANAPPSSTPDWVSEEHDLWTGKTIDMLTEGGLSPNHYRLTTRSLFYKHGRVGSVEHSVPLWAVRGVTLEQKLIDKARHVGDLVVQVEHDDWTQDVKEVRLDDIENASQVRDLILKQAREESYNYERRKQTMFYQGRPPLQPPQ